MGPVAGPEAESPGSGPSPGWCPTTWPPNSCEGAFVRNPRNAPLLAMVEEIVAP